MKAITFWRPGLTNSLTSICTYHDKGLNELSDSVVLIDCCISLMLEVAFASDFLVYMICCLPRGSIEPANVCFLPLSILNLLF